MNLEEEEIWKDIEETEGFYQVSNLGRFKRVARQRDKKYFDELILTLGHYSNDYPQFNCSVNGVRITAIAHRLVAKYFVDNPLNLPEVNHKDGVRRNIRADNLEWTTRSGNIRHSFDVLGRQSASHVGVLNTNCTLTEEDVLKIRYLYDNKISTQSDIAKCFNMKKAAIWKIVNNYTWKHLLDRKYERPK